MASRYAADEDEDEGTGKFLIISHSKTASAEDILKGVLGCDSLENVESAFIEGNITYFPWEIKNKYYSASIVIGFASESDPTLHETELLKTVDAFLFGFDLNNESQLIDIEAWLSCLEDIAPSIQLLFASETSPDDVPESRRQAMLRWCAEHSFELIERYAAETYEDDDYPEKFGFDRIREALQVHTWPNMVMREDVPGDLPRQNGLSALDNTKRKEEAAESEKDVASEQYGYQSLVNQMDDAIIDDVEGQSFEELFDKLKEMKDRAMSMPLDERKDYAEKVVVAFWKALGGDDDEIEGI